MTLALVIGMSAAFGLLWWQQQSEIRYLRRRLDARQDHEQRVERVAAGLGELPALPAEADAPPVGVQMQLDALVGAWESGTSQKQKWDDVSGWRQEGRSWEWIVNELREELA